MRRLSIRIGILAVVALLAAWAGPGWAGGPKGKVVIWFDSGAAWNSFIADFNKDLAAKYPDITVEWVTQDTAQLSAKLVTAFAAKQGPDIAMGSQYRLVAPEQQFKAWADLSGKLASDPEMKEIAAALPKVHVDAYYSGNKLWGLPQVVQAVGLFVRKSWMDEIKAKPPEDWNELTALAERFTKRDQFGYCIFGAPGVTNSSGIQFEYSGAAAGMQYPIVDPEGKPSFNTPVGVLPENQCGKVVYAGMHVSSGSTVSTNFPTGCSGALTPDEKAFIFLLFDLQNCVGQIF